MGLAMQIFSNSKRELCAALPFSCLLSTHLRDHRSGKEYKTMMMMMNLLSFISFLMHCVLFVVEQLEEGEKDLVRSQEYKYCMYK